MKASVSHARNKDLLCAEDKTESQLTGARKAVRFETVDVAVGVGHPLMDAARINRGLARIAMKGIRTTKVREIAGIPVVMTTELPEGVAAMMTTEGMTAFRIETGARVVTLARSAVELMTGGAPIRRTPEEATPMQETSPVPVFITTGFPYGAGAMMAMGRITTLRAGEPAASVSIPLPPRA